MSMLGAGLGARLGIGGGGVGVAQDVGVLGHVALPAKGAHRAVHVALHVRHQHRVRPPAHLQFYTAHTVIIVRLWCCGPGSLQAILLLEPALRLQESVQLPCCQRPWRNAQCDVPCSTTRFFRKGSLPPTVAGGAVSNMTCT